MPSLNQVTIIGHLGKAPEMKFLATGTPVTTFSVACSEKWKDKDSGESKEKTEWVNVVAWRQLAEVCNQYLQKGQLVYIQGKLQTRSWEGQDGQKHYRTEVVADKMLMLGRKKEDGQAASHSADFDDEVSF